MSDETQVLAEFIGGPRDGELHAIRAPAARWIEFPTFTRGQGLGVVRYELAGEWGIVPLLRYVMCEEDA